MNRSVLTKSDRHKLAAARRRERKNATTATVPEHTMPVYRLSDPEERRIARWADVETAVLRLCSDRDRRGRQDGDTRRLRDVVDLLHDTFKGS